MPNLGGRVRGCYRCAYVWRLRGAGEPRVCARCKSDLWDVPLLHRIRVGAGPGIESILAPHREEILRLAELHHFSHVRVFGSLRRRQATRTSDVDLLVAPGPSVSLLDRIGLQQDLQDLLGRPVDVVEDDAVHWLFRPQVLFEAVAL